MNIEKAIKDNITDLLNTSDLLLAKLKEVQKEVVDIIGEIVTCDKKGEDCSTQVNKHRSLIAVSYLIDQDLSKALVQLSTTYRVAKVTGIDLKLPETEIKRLEFSLANEAFHFINVKGEIVPRDSELYTKIQSRIESNKEFTTEQFLQELRKTEVYGKKG